MKMMTTKGMLIGTGTLAILATGCAVFLAIQNSRLRHSADGLHLLYKDELLRLESIARDDLRKRASPEDFAQLTNVVYNLNDGPLGHHTIQFHRNRLDGDIASTDYESYDIDWNRKTVTYAGSGGTDR